MFVDHDQLISTEIQNNVHSDHLALLIN